jgi:hypothetical protein
MWVWEQLQSFSLLQTGAKDIGDKQASGTVRTTHLWRQGLQRYQSSACGARTRLCFLGRSHRLNHANGTAFMVLVLMWLRAHDLQANVTLQANWGEGFGGDRPTPIAQLASR